MPKQIFNYDVVEFEENKSKLVKLRAITHLLESCKDKPFEIDEGELDEDGTFSMGGYIYHPAISHINDLLYDGGFIIVYDWNSEIYDICKKDLDEIGKLSEIGCYKLITSIIRGNRFNEGLLGDAIQNEIFPKTIERLLEIIIKKQVM